MASFAVVPAAPVLLPGIDELETERITSLRNDIETVLSSHEQWALPVDALPVLAGLGGWGIDRGIDTRTGHLLTGEAWVGAVDALTDEERGSCETAHPAIGVVLLHAHAAAVRIGPFGTSEHLLVPIDLSAAASEDAPLAPVDGAREFDESVVHALKVGDTTTLSRAAAKAPNVHADLALLEAALPHLGTGSWAFETAFDDTVHEVRSLCGRGAR